MPEIVEGLETVGGTLKKRRGRPPKVVVPAKPRGKSPIEQAFGPDGRIAAKMLPPDQRKALLAALRCDDAGVTDLRERIARLTAKLNAIENSESIVEDFRNRLAAAQKALTQ